MSLPKITQRWLAAVGAGTSGRLVVVLHAAAGRAAQVSARSVAQLTPADDVVLVGSGRER